MTFTVVNTTILDARGSTSVSAVRTFHFLCGDRQRVDAVNAERDGVVDRLEQSRALIAALSATVVNEALRMTSTAIAVRIGRVRIRPPRPIAPFVTHAERFDDENLLQHVTVMIDAPIVGRVYKCSGSSSYAIRPGNS